VGVFRVGSDYGRAYQSRLRTNYDSADAATLLPSSTNFIRQQLQQQQRQRLIVTDEIRERHECTTTRGDGSCCSTSRGSKYPDDVLHAIEGAAFIAEHLKDEDEGANIKEDWKYVALVLDRLFLWIFTTACLVGTFGIILQAPTIYDDRRPVTSS
jgi:hypothetical protein